MNDTLNLLQEFQKDFKAHLEEEMTLMEYLDLCKKDPTVYATAPERMLKAIGAPTLVDTSKDARLSRVFSNRTISVYPAFSNFYGMEETVENIVSYFKHAAQGLEERKQILYLLGPVGGGKSSLAEKLKELMESFPIYTLKAGNQLCPNFENPLGLFNPEKWGDRLKDNFGIDRRYLTGLIGPWTMKRLKEFDGDITKFKVVKLFPSKLKQIAIAKTEPGDENNQDISALVGKTDIRKLERYSQNDPDSYAFSGGLCIANQGLLEFVEMFKAPIKVLHPLLTATQEGNYNGTESLSAIPFDGVILAHSNESEWQTFKNNKNNEAFLDRVYIVKVPYCLRVDEEVKIYQKLLASSSLKNAPCAPHTLEMLARFAILTRLVEPENSSIFSKLRVYNGENLKDVDPHAKSVLEYRQFAGQNEGMEGISTRFAFKILSKVFNYDKEEIAANPVHLLYILETAIEKEQFSNQVEEKYLSHLMTLLKPQYAKFISEEIQKAYLDSYGDYGQNMFDRYIMFADHWIQDRDYRDPDTGEIFDRAALNAELEKIEKSGGIANPKDFRNEVVNFSLRYRAENNGKNPSWTAYKKITRVIEKRMFSATEDILPIISFTTKGNKNDQAKHQEFVKRMTDRGYTERQVRMLVDWYIRVQKHS